MLQRPHGRLAFAVLRDQTGDIQLFALEKATDRFDELSALPLGTWVRATGEVVKTRKGELSVKVADWAVLARPTRPFPDKWHGITDPDTRYRQRYVDAWVSPEVRPTLLARSKVVSLCRRWLEDRASSRSRPRSSTPSRAARWPSRSPPTTTRWTWTSSCASRPSST